MARGEGDVRDVGDQNESTPDAYTTPVKLTCLCVVAIALLTPGCDRPKSDDAEPVKGEPKSKEVAPEPTPTADDATATPVAERAAKPEPLSFDRSPPTLTTVDEAARARAKELVEQYDGNFSFQMANRHNALALLHIAHSETDVGLVADALEAIGWAYGPKQDDDDRAFDADYFAVVRYRLGSDEPKIEEGAFKAAKEGMDARPADAGLLAVLVDRAYYHPKLAGRMLAIEALASMKTPNRVVGEVFHHALDESSAPFVALTLERLSFGVGDRLPDQDRLERRLIELMAHDDPGIRGRAAVALADRTPSDDAERARISGLIAPLGADPHGFVRLCSLQARADVKDRKMLPELIALLDDRTKTRFQVEGWVELDGTRGSVTLNHVGMRETARESAVIWLQRATKGQPDAFDPTPLDSSHREASIDRRVQEVKDWAARNAASSKAG